MMRVIGLMAILLAGCELFGEPPAANVCEEAQRQFQDCGVTVPLLGSGPCTGLARSTSMCVVDYATTCAEVASLARRPDLCFVSLVDLPAGAPPAAGSGGSLFPEGPVGGEFAGGEASGAAFGGEADGGATDDGADDADDGANDADGCAGAPECTP